jgi:hypothetical protein
MGALNGFCMGLRHADARGSLESDPDGGNMRFRVRPGPDAHSWAVEFKNLSNDERLGIEEIFDTVGYSGAMDWTGPTDAGDVKYRFEQGSWEETMLTANDTTIRFTLREAAGVA